MPDDPDWDTVCEWMVMECEESDDPIEGFKAPSAELVHKYCALYPRFAEDFVDFAATCRTDEYFLKKYPPPEPDEADVKKTVDRAMKVIRKTLRAERRKGKADAG